ncbi:penicillin-binding protein 1C [Thiorhodovibrio frisius]|uniref:peptidoglycan glycosyltransferase n=1 Tax=Thiorhodovibrio frisius TaxID=631362 RepID=H8Z2A8_9GAMM|nr:penicillin-binding protein 1C [Thiorhodovibrio frisius]EIC22670.1 penicillin-binding protein 1C [Thiorhodovibrio frisius]WPL22426.1 Penicillin-binding protein F [Thiorhodovibrio frisius]
MIARVLQHYGLPTALILILGLLGAFSIASRLQPPPELTTPVSRLILDRDGQLLRAAPVSDGRWRLPLRLKDIDPQLIDLLLVWEDRRFFTHHGVDWAAMVRALTQMLGEGRIVSGGSTLSMQLVRLLEQSHTRSLSGKWQQVLGALALERSASKTEILQAYLQHAGYGGNLEGVRSASLAYFGKEPRRLSAAEAALLVALPQSPERRRPDRFPETARDARNRVLARAAARGIISPELAEQAMQEAVPRQRRPLPQLAAHRAEYWWRRLPDAPVLQLTLSAPLQQALETLAREHATALAPSVSLAIMVVEHSSGEVLASVGSAGYTDVARDGFIDMTDAVRSPGSTLKPLIYGLGFELGIAHPESLIEDRPMGFGDYAPANFDGDFTGTVTVREALQRSLNVPAVIMLEHIGPVRLLARLRRAGAAPQLPGNRPAGLAIALGGVGLRLRDLMALYTAIARGGQPVALSEQRALSTTSPTRRPSPPTPVLDPRAAWYLTSILSGANATNGGAAAIAVKTGTSFGYRDAWALGFDGRHVVGVWAGRPDGAPVTELTGASVAVPILVDAFARLGRPTAFPAAPPGILQLSSDQLPSPLQKVGSRSAHGFASPQVQIAYPPDGARIDLNAANSSSSPPALILKARGGQPPFRWIINGQPIRSDAFARSSRWYPDGRGFARVLLIDAAGSQATTQIFID